MHVFARAFDEQAPEAAQMARNWISVPIVVTVDSIACVELLCDVHGCGLVEPNGVVGTISRASTAFRQGKSSPSSVSSIDKLVQHLVGAIGTHSRALSRPRFEPTQCEDAHV